MLCTNVKRQRISVEFLTTKNLYDEHDSLLIGFLLDLIGSIRMGASYDITSVSPDGGTSILIHCEEGYVMLHAWAPEQFASVDIFSLQSFEEAEVLRIIDYYFEPFKVEVV